MVLITAVLSPEKEKSSRKTKCKLSKLETGKKYYIKVRVYKVYTDELGQEVTADGKWSIVITKKMK